MPCDVTGLTGSQLIGFARNQQKKRLPVAYHVYIYIYIPMLRPERHLESSHPWCEWMRSSDLSHLPNLGTGMVNPATYWPARPVHWWYLLTTIGTTISGTLSHVTGVRIDLLHLSLYEPYDQTYTITITDLPMTL